MKSYVLPEWWQDEMADLPANRALAEAYIAKQLGFQVTQLRDKAHPLSDPPTAQVRFKRYKNEVDDKVRVSVIVAQRAARYVARWVEESTPPFTAPTSALEIRNEILRKSQNVDLKSLLELCWRKGIAVLPLAQTPSKSKRFDGMATFIDHRPVIVLASGRDSPPWLAFTLAHELGHIMLSHVSPGSTAMIDGSLASDTGSSTHERAADRFACELLTGHPEPSIRQLKANGPQLAIHATRFGRERGIDPGVLTLIYAKSNSRWGAAQTALKYLQLDHGGRAQVSNALDRYLDRSDLPEADERFLNVLA